MSAAPHAVAVYMFATEIFQQGEHNTSQSQRPGPFAPHVKTFPNTDILRFVSTATGLSNHTGVSGPSLVIQLRFNDSYYSPLLSNESIVYVALILPTNTSLFILCVDRLC